jgi:alkanesulfonate monooxygenase SsuD/methylene tetrahydromethanopterin reductase-like flavin-dependent oxidoreductase (luciferase family)
VVAPLYHPVVLAEELATLDIVSGGRLIVGAGLGYRQEEYTQLGVPFEERTARFEEAMQLMVALWTQDVVDHHGRFWTLDGARPHLRCVQQPHAPLWLGAHKPPGVRRAARLGDTWVVPPEFTPARIAECVQVFREERTRLGKPMPDAFPARREVVVGRSREHAVERFAGMARARYLTYAERGLASHDATALRDQFAAAVDGHIVAGTPDQVVSTLSALAVAVPIDPVIVRPQWPDMPVADVVAYLDELGCDVIPALRGVAAH